ncbi:GNAT family N-acetyltransferase [Mycoplasmatota bacterium]|nr:GNAT family N-acetyltransferase [Mycoplasmatota bacterium]
MIKKELKELIFKDKTYIGLLAIQDDHVVGRVLYTYDDSKHKKSKVCYFSMFEAIDDINVTKQLFNAIYQDMKKHHITYLEGSFTPYDPDTRRGILIKGFDEDPALFTSYNPPYYQKHFESLGFYKAFDTLLLDGGNIDEKNFKLLKRLYDFTVKGQKIRIDYIDIKKIDQEINDIVQIMSQSETEVIYQDSPTKDMIYDAFHQMKSFINPKFITIAREVDTNRPIGFAFVLPDYNQIIKKTKGHVLLFPFINKKKINKAIGKLQYVIPEYQKKGIMAAMYFKVIDQLFKQNIKSIDMGTMMEDNYQAFHHFKRFGGHIKKVFRIYGKDITS